MRQPKLQRRQPPVVGYVGVDPGITGAISCLRTQGKVVIEVLVTPMPVAMKRSGRREVDVVALYGALFEYFDLCDQTLCLIERVSAMPGQGPSSMFSLGDSFGTARGVLAALCAESAMGHAKLDYVAPITWKKAMKLNADKKYSLNVARTAFPGLRTTQLKLEKSEGLAEALLLARYGHLHHIW